MFNLFSLDSFLIFSQQHLIILLIFTCITVGLSILGNRLRKNKNSELILLISKMLIGFAIIQELLDYTNRYLNGTLSLSVDLPFHICNYVLLLSIITIYNKNEYLFNFCYFNAFSGALVANLTPDTNGVIGDLGLFFFFIHHFLIMINVLWMIFAYKMIPTFKGLLVTAMMLNLFGVPIALINWLIGDGANYMYLCKKPPVDNILLVGEWPFYIFAMEVIGFMIFLILLMPFKVGGMIRQSAN